jgi:hypothetical protein
VERVCTGDSVVLDTSRSFNFVVEVVEVPLLSMVCAVPPMSPVLVMSVDAAVLLLSPVAVVSVALEVVCDTSRTFNFVVEVVEVPLLSMVCAVPPMSPVLVMSVDAAVPLLSPVAVVSVTPDVVCDTSRTFNFVVDVVEVPLLSMVCAVPPMSPVLLRWVVTSCSGISGTRGGL